jgi:Xaa-Pro dipeptidase
MRTHVVGRPKPLHGPYRAAALEALHACAAELRPGRTAGEVFAAHARVFDARGASAHRLNACGYALGARFTPSWMDMPMFYEGNAHEIGPDEVYFLHMILMDSGSQTAMCLGRTYVTREGAAEAINAADLDLASQ